MLVLGIESSCDETGVALVAYDGMAIPALQAHALHSQADMHRDYGGVVPELASRDHIRRVLPLLQQVLSQARVGLDDIDLVAYTRGPGLAGALLVGAACASALGAALDRPVLGVHHLEGHLLSPFLSDDPPQFPFVALLVSGGHTQLMRVDGVGDYALLGETIDDAAGEAFDKSAKLLGLGYPGGPALARLAAQGRADAFALPRPLLHSGDLDFSFAGLKTAVMTQQRKLGSGPSQQMLADLAAATQAAIVDVLVKKSRAGAARHRAQAPRRGGRRRRQRAAAGASECAGVATAVARALPGAGAVHRQRRHDRAGRRDAGAARPGHAVARLCVRRAAALAARADLHGPARVTGAP